MIDQLRSIGIEEGQPFTPDTTGWIAWLSKHEAGPPLNGTSQVPSWLVPA
jgi:hypothetical protein